MMKSLLAKFGMIPSSRSRAVVEYPQDEENPLAKFLNQNQAACVG